MFIHDLVWLWRRSDRFRVLLVGASFLCFVCASQQRWLQQMIPFFQNFPQLVNQTGLSILWILAGVLWLWTIYEAARTKKDALTQAEKFTERKAIKGLRPFTEADREIFQYLERDRPLQECLAKINGEDFRFGILFGESGCGKTSFLQAGLMPQLCEPESKIQGIYVPFSDRDPLLTIHQALVEQLPLMPEAFNQADLLELLCQGVEAASKPLILVFDQFEQFFVHFNRKEDRQFFIQALADWYDHPEPPPVKFLISIRKDFYAYLVELKKAFGERYSLSNQEVIELEKFSPEQATKVLEVITKTENLEFDRHFIAEVAAEELASRKDGLISPVDLQILAWTITDHKIVELQAFNQTALQKLGGIQGLLTRFLEAALQARVTDLQREATVKVLLGLTDLKHQARTGALTLREVQVKLPDLNSHIVEETVNWLAGESICLITSVEREGVSSYELAHEQIIPALLEISGKFISEANRATKLLDRRVNLWLGSHRSSRFRLNLWELWLIRSQKPYLIWGKKRQQKERLIAASWQASHKKIALVAAIGVLLTLIWWGWQSPPAQLWQIRRDLTYWTMKVDDEMAGQAAVAFAKDRNFAKAEEICDQEIQEPKIAAKALTTSALVANKLQQRAIVTLLLQKALVSAEHIDDSYSRVEVLTAIASAYVQLKNPQQVSRLLQKAVANAEEIDYYDHQAQALTAIVEVTRQLHDSKQAAQLLQKILASADQIDHAYYRATVLTAIASAYIQLPDSEQAAQLLQKAFDSADQIDASQPRVELLTVIAAAYIQLPDSDQAFKVLLKALVSAEHIDNSDSRASALSLIAGASSQLPDSSQAFQLLEGILDSSQQISAPLDRAKTLMAIAEASSQLPDSSQAAQLLEKILASTRQIPSPRERASTLKTIAAVYIQLPDSSQAAQLLTEALASAEQIDASNYKAWELRAIATTSSQLPDSKQASKLLEQALASAEQIDSYNSRARALVVIATAYMQLPDSKQASKLLEQALASAEQIDNSDYKARGLRAIAQTSSQLPDSNQASELLEETLTSAEQIDDLYYRAGVLRAIAEAYIHLQDSNQASKLLEKALASAGQIEALNEKVWGLVPIGEIYAKLGNWSQVRHIALDKCPHISCKVELLTNALTIRAEQHYPQLIEP